MIGGLLYRLVYACAIAPGILPGTSPRRAGHPAGWIIGGVIGYGLTQLALSVPIILHVPSPLAFVGAWAVEVAVVWRLPAASPLRSALPAYIASDRRAIALTLLLAAVVMFVPYRNLGRADAAGTGTTGRTSRLISSGTQRSLPSSDGTRHRRVIPTWLRAR